MRADAVSEERISSADPSVMWGVAFQPVGMRETDHLVSYLDGTLTESEAGDLAEQFASRADIARAWPVRRVERAVSYLSM